MTYADKGLALFSLMNDMSDSLINESDIGGVVAVKPKRERTGRFSAFMNHPAMVAVLCAVVSLGVVVAIVMAGRGGPVTPPVGTPPVEETVTQEPFDSETETSDLFETNSAESDTNDKNQDPSQIEVHVIATKGDNNHIVPQKYKHYDGYWEGDQQIAGEPMDGFRGKPEEVENLPSTRGCWFDVILLGDCRLQWVTVYDTEMNQMIQDHASSPLKVHLEAGTYYVVLQVFWEKGLEFGADQYVFAMNLDEPLESLGFTVIHADNVEIFPPEESETHEETRYEPSESVYACTLVSEQTVYSVNANYIKTTIVAAEPGKTWEGNGMSYRLCRLEGGREIEVYSYAVEPWGESNPTGPDDYATLPLWCNLTEVRRVLSEKGESLTAGKYRMYYLADTYLGIECPYVDVELVDPSELTAECEAEAYVCGFATAGVLVRIEGIGNVLVHDSKAEEKWVVSDILRIRYNQRDMDQNGGTLIDKTQWDTPFVYEWRLTDFVEITVVSSET